MTKEKVTAAQLEKKVADAPKSLREAVSATKVELLSHMVEKLEAELFEERKANNALALKSGEIRDALLLQQVSALQNMVNKLEKEHYEVRLSINGLALQGQEAVTRLNTVLAFIGTHALGKDIDFAGLIAQ